MSLYNPSITLLLTLKISSKYFLLFEEINNIEPEKIVIYDRGSPILNFKVSVQ